MKKYFNRNQTLAGQSTDKAGVDQSERVEEQGIEESLVDGELPAVSKVTVVPKKRNLLLDPRLWIIIPVIIFSLVLFFEKDLDPSIFNKIPVDKYAKKYADPIVTDGTFAKATFDFEDTLVFFDGKAGFSLDNPPSASQYMVLSIEISDKELLDKIGKTGRSATDQAKLNQLSEYNTQTSRIEVCSTGIVPPGYKLPTLEMKKLPDGTDLPTGKYSGVASITLYSSSGNKSNIDSQLPVTVIVK